MSSGSYKNVAAKVLKMVKSVGVIPRNGSNQRFNYKFVKETDVADKMREACLGAGLVVIPSAHDMICTTIKGEGGKGDQYRTSLMLRLTLIDPDTGESIDMDFPGEAIDSQDKAVPKAITSAYKYGLLKLAMNGGGDGDDPEHDSNETGGTSGKDQEGSGKAKPVQQGATYRKPEESATPAGKPATTAPPTEAKPKPADPKPNPSQAPADKPLSTQTAPPNEQKSTGGDEVPTIEDTGKITTVVPAMKGKPASLSFKRSSEGGGVYQVHFDAKTVDVPGLLQFLNKKTEVRIICDISSGNPYLMSVTEA